MGQHSAEVFRRDCPTCGTEFEYKFSKNGRHRVFCSRPCFVGGRRGAGNYLPPPRRFRVTTTCEECGAEMPKKVHNHRWCKVCAPTRTAQGRLQRYGVSQPAWDRMAARFGGNCWICREKPATCVDHCHRTGRVRGVLCDGCNAALAALERPEWELRAREYLAQGR